MGTSSQRTWDRMSYGMNDIAELRARVTSNVVLLTAFFSMSQIAVEQKLDKLLEQFQIGYRQESVLSMATVESLTYEDREAWRAIRKELEDIGVSVAAFEANKSFIMEWFQNAVDNNAFEERRPITPSDGCHVLEPQPNTSTKDLRARSSQVVTDSLPQSQHDHFESSTITYTAKHETARKEVRADDPMMKAPWLSAKPINEQIPKNHKSKLASLLRRVLGTDKPFLEACKNGNQAEAARLLQGGADINAFPGGLYEAAGWDQVRIAKWLLECGATVQQAKSNPLHRASFRGYLEIIHLLLDHGANPNFQWRYSKHTPLMYAAMGKQFEAVYTLMGKGADVNMADYKSWTALHYAAQNGDVTTVEYLLENGAEINQSREETGALSAALSAGQDKVSHILLDRGADFGESYYRLRSSKGTALHLAVDNKCRKTIDLLLMKGVDHNARDSKVRTAKDIAADNNDRDLVRRLEREG